MSYDLVLFDLDETLFDFQKAETFALAEAFRSIGVTAPEGHLETYQEVNRAIWDRYERGEVGLQDLKVRRFADFLAALGIEADARAFGRSVIDGLAKADFLFPDADTVVSKVRARTRVAAVTNGLARVQRSRLRRTGLDAAFEYVAISEELGVGKPDPAIFRAVFDELSGVSPDKSLIVGDSLTSDIQGGAAFGLTTCWCDFRDRGLRRHWESHHRTPLGSEPPQPDLIIKSIAELTEHV